MLAEAQSANHNGSLAGLYAIGRYGNEGYLINHKSFFSSKFAQSTFAKTWILGEDPFRQHGKGSLHLKVDRLVNKYGSLHRQGVSTELSDST